MIGGDARITELGVPKPGFLQILRGSALLRSFAAFFAQLRSLLTCICAHLRVSASDRV